MASWGTLIAFTGFRYDGVEQHLIFKASKEPVTWFWSNGDALGTAQQEPSAGGTKVSVAVLGGTIAIQRITLTGRGTTKLRGVQKLGPSGSFDCTV